jgi:hypothetical protein
MAALMYDHPERPDHLMPNAFNAGAPTILWRLSRDRDSAHATILPGEPRVTLTWFVNGVMDRAENYDTETLALARADHIRSILVQDGWMPDED